MAALIEPGRVLAQKYRVKRWLAMGGMGAVWVGEHIELGFPVAIKAIKESEVEPATRVRFKREARAAATLRSAHVVRVFDYGVEDDTPYLIMELLEGEDLKDRLLREGRLRLPAVATITAQLAEALHEAHEIGLVHRDVKPRNIFLAREGSRETTKLLDFGVARDMSTEGNGDETVTGFMLGSPRYMSPEQARAERVDRRSDVWSLAVVAYEMLIGHPPFTGPGAGRVLAQVLNDEPPPIRSQAPSIPEAVEHAFRLALQRDRAKRCADPREFADKLWAAARSGDELRTNASAARATWAATNARGPSERVATPEPQLRGDTAALDSFEGVNSPSHARRTHRRWWSAALVASAAAATVGVLGLSFAAPRHRAWSRPVVGTSQGYVALASTLPSAPAPAKHLGERRHERDSDTPTHHGTVRPRSAPPTRPKPSTRSPLIISTNPY